MALFVVFGLDTGLALTSSYLPFDPPLTRSLQSVDWGPLLGPFALVSFLGGQRQLVVAAAGVVLVVLLNRRAWLLIVAGLGEGVIYGTLNIVIHRPRPDAQLVHVLTHTPGYGYPSGHAAFFTAFSVLLLYCLGGERWRPPFLAAGWILVIVVVMTVSISRLYEGSHWPSDVAGGLALGGAWAALVMSIRRLSDPVLAT